MRWAGWLLRGLLAFQEREFIFFGRGGWGSGRFYPIAKGVHFFGFSESAFVRVNQFL